MLPAFSIPPAVIIDIYTAYYRYCAHMAFSAEYALIFNDIDSLPSYIITVICSNAFNDADGHRADARKS
jgi:hypothetical protein